jgi:hypothetical protein
MQFLEFQIAIWDMMNPAVTACVLVDSSFFQHLRRILKDDVLRPAIPVFAMILLFWGAFAFLTYV